MGVANDRALGLRPSENGLRPTRPIFDDRRAWVIVFLETQQTDVSAMRRGEAADFDVVPHHIVGAGKLRDFALEILLLRVPAGAPRQHAADVQVFTHDLPHHVGRGDAFGRAVVMGTAGCVHVMVARVPMLVRRVHPTRQLEFGGLGRFIRLHAQRLVLDQVFRSAGVFDFVVAGRKKSVSPSARYTWLWKKKSGAKRRARFG